MILLQWDPTKSSSNFRKHRITFEEAVNVFDDPYVLEYFDKAHSHLEDRFWAIGQGSKGRILKISYTFRRSQNVQEAYYRLISARRANVQDQRDYDQARKRRESKRR